jgi:hypothetical protein
MSSERHMSKEKQFKHGPELRQWWRQEKAKYRKTRVREAPVPTETSLTRESASCRGDSTDG